MVFFIIFKNKAGELLVKTNPYLIAVLASFLLGVVIFPWMATLKRLSSAELFMFIGGAYVITGATQYFLADRHNKMTAAAIGLAALTAITYSAAIMCINYVFGSRNINIPVATAITASYPAITAAISFAMLGQNFTAREAIFFLMTVVGVIGLGLSAKPQQ